MGHLPFQGEVIDIGDSPRVLIIKPSSLGDIIHSLPFLSALKHSYPRASVHWAVFKGLEGILKGHPLIDRLVVIDKRAIKRPATLIPSIRRLRSDLSSQAYDMAIDLQGLLRSGLLSLMSSAPLRAGFSDAREGAPLFYNQKVQGGKDIHAVDRYLRIAAMLGCDISEVNFPMVHDECAPPFDGEYAVIVPGARWKTKLWPAERFGSLAAMLPIRSVVVGGPEDTLLADKVVAHSGGKAMSMTGKTSLRELSGLIRNASYMVTNDTGPMHIAAAHRVAVFAIFGPTSHVRTGPYGDGHTIITPAVPCAPCYRRRCNDLKCMDSISPEAVFDAISIAQRLI